MSDSISVKNLFGVDVSVPLAAIPGTTGMSVGLAIADYHSYNIDHVIVRPQKASR